MRIKPDTIVGMIGGAFFFLTVAFYAREMTIWTKWKEWSTHNFRNAFVVGGGEHWIHLEVLQMRKLVQRSAQKEFALYGQLKERFWIEWSAYEFLYPVRISESSPMVLVKKGDENLLQKNCKELDFEGEIGLYECV